MNNYFYNILIIVSIIGIAYSEQIKSNESIAIFKLQQGISLSELTLQIYTYYNSNNNNGNGNVTLPQCDNAEFNTTILVPCITEKKCDEIGDILNLTRFVKRDVKEVSAPTVSFTASSLQIQHDDEEMFEKSTSRSVQHDEMPSLDTIANPSDTCYIIRYITSEREELPSPPPPPKHKRHETWKMWLFGFLSVGIISLSGVMGVIFVPIMKNKIFQVVMRILVGLGVGTLSATAILQLIPECFELKKHSIDHLLSSTIIWLSVWIFFMFESICKIVLQKKNDESKVKSIATSRKSSNAHNHSHVHPPLALQTSEQDSFMPVPNAASWQRRSSMDSTDHVTLNSVYGSRHNIPITKPSHHRSHELLADGSYTISSVAWMIIFGDGLHNFIDGVSIGAGFTESITTGVSISLAIMCEEFPHELGDFAILINSGMSVKKALIFNFASACTAFAGLVLGLSLEQLEINSYIFGFAGGLFLYISLADLMPQLNEMVDDALTSKSKKSAVYILMQQNIGILSGLVILFLITKYGDSIRVDW